MAKPLLLQRYLPAFFLQCICAAASLMGGRGILLSSQLAGHCHCYGSPPFSCGAADPRSISLRLHKNFQLSGAQGLGVWFSSSQAGALGFVLLLLLLGSFSASVSPLSEASSASLSLSLSLSLSQCS